MKLGKLRLKEMILGMSCIGCLLAIPSRGELFQIEDGWWRIEVQGSRPFGFNHIRKGDSYYAGSVEYEFPIFGDRFTGGLRLYPFYIYHEKNDDDNESNTIYGAGGGLTFRWYQNRKEHDGFFLEAGSAPFWISEELENNNASLLFLNEFGAGYKFHEIPLHFSIKYAHTSNAFLSEPNDGVDALTLAVGFSF